MNNMVIPDSVEPVIAWRTWRLRTLQDVTTIRSINSTMPWRPREAHKAICYLPNYLRPVPPQWIVRNAQPLHNAPAENCRCGIYATDSWEMAVRLARTWCGDVVGRVALWGRVVEHEAGWRAEYAYPVELFLCSQHYSVESVREHLADTYGVPCKIILPCVR